GRRYRAADSPRAPRGYNGPGWTSRGPCRAQEREQGSMDQNRLAEYIERPEVQRRILGDFRGGYSLGLTAHPEDPAQVAIRVRVEGDDDSGIPRHITLDGDTVPVVVSKNFVPPKPL